MSTSTNHDRLISAWLEDEAPEHAPERLLTAAREQIRTTTQRRSVWPAGRTPTMNKIVAFGLAAAAVVIVAFIGIQLLGGSNVMQPDPSETPSSSVSPSAAPSAAGDTQPPAGFLEPDTPYRVTRQEVALTITFPTDVWRSDGSFWFEGHAASGDNDHSRLWLFPTTGTPGHFTDPCAHEGLEQFEDSAAGVAEALSTVPGTEIVGGPTDVTVDGNAAVYVTFAYPDDLGCDQYWTWHDPECGAVIECTWFPNWAGETVRIWAVDLGGGVEFLIQFETRSPDSSAGLEEELQQIVDSIQFE